MKRRKSAGVRLGVAGATISLTAALGLGAGVAFAATTNLSDSLGISRVAGGAATAAPAPDYAENSAGETFGSSALAVSPSDEPDLILVEATNGLVGYVKKADLDAANGVADALSFDSPADALDWQEDESNQVEKIAVYRVDGVTVIGEFLVQ